MTDGSLASAVALPDEEIAPAAPPIDTSLKRRNSSLAEPDTHAHPTTSTTDADNKRRRLSSTTDHPAKEAHHPPDSAARKPSKPSKPSGGREEERKRGRRLFGGLLGTLSQGPSSSSAQKRRADIERRQQDKLKLQDAEYGELKKKRREERMVVRRREQRVYEGEMMRTRHSNMLAMAHFLKTRAQPVLYYRPWQLRPADEEIIRDQIEEAEATIAREVAEFEARQAAQAEEDQKESPDESANAAKGPEAGKEDGDKKEDIAGTDAEMQTGDNEENRNEADKEAAVPPPAVETSTHEPMVDHGDVHRAADDDGGEVVEDQEDTVIY